VTVDGVSSESIKPTQILRLTDFERQKNTMVNVSRRVGYYVCKSIGSIRYIPTNRTINLEVSYIARPQAIVFATTIDLVNDIEVFNPSASIDFTFDESEFHNLESLILFELGIAIRDNAVVQFAAANIAK
jgi:hypothetical protein